MEGQQCRLKDLECQLEDAERRLADEQVEVEGLRYELAEKTECLQVEVRRLSLQVNDFRNQLDAMKIECSKMETRAISAE